MATCLVEPGQPTPALSTIGPRAVDIAARERPYLEMGQAQADRSAANQSGVYHVSVGAQQCRGKSLQGHGGQAASDIKVPALSYG